MKKYKPFISIIIPTYNAARTLDKCIKSIVYQTYRRWEIIIVDSNSSDDTPNIALKWCKILGSKRLRYINIPLRSRSLARNMGVKRARGDRILTLDADCILPRTFLETCVRYINEKGDPEGLRVFLHDTKKNGSQGYMGMCYYVFCISGSETRTREPFPNLIKRDVFLKLGGQKPFMEFGEDAEFDYRFRKAGFRAPLAPECIVYHIEPFSVTSIVRKHLISYNVIYQRADTNRIKDKVLSIVRRIIRCPYLLLGLVLLSMISTIVWCITKIKTKLKT